MYQYTRTFGTSVMGVNIKVIDVHYVHVYIIHKVMFMSVALTHPQTTIFNVIQYVSK